MLPAGTIKWFSFPSLVGLMFSTVLSTCWWKTKPAQRIFQGQTRIVYNAGPHNDLFYCRPIELPYLGVSLFSAGPQQSKKTTTMFALLEPGIPQNLQCSNPRGSDRVTLAWDPVQNSPGLSYELYEVNNFRWMYDDDDDNDDDGDRE